MQPECVSTSRAPTRGNGTIRRQSTGLLGRTYRDGVRPRVSAVRRAPPSGPTRRRRAQRREWRATMSTVERTARVEAAAVPRTKPRQPRRSQPVAASFNQFPYVGSPRALEDRSGSRSVEQRPHRLAGRGAELPIPIPLRETGRRLCAEHVSMGFFDQLFAHQRKPKRNANSGASVDFPAVGSPLTRTTMCSTDVTVHRLISEAGRGSRQPIRAAAGTTRLEPTASIERPVLSRSLTAGRGASPETYTLRREHLTP